jgi:hypothetical protein
MERLKIIFFGVVIQLGILQITTTKNAEIKNLNIIRYFISQVVYQNVFLKKKFV